MASVILDYGKTIQSLQEQLTEAKEQLEAQKTEISATGTYVKIENLKEAEAENRKLSSDKDYAEMQLEEAVTDANDSKYDLFKKSLELAARDNLIKNVMNLCEKNEKRRSSGLVGCDEIRRILNLGE